MSKSRRLNTVQLSALRRASDGGYIGADRCTAKALRDRGYAVEDAEGKFFITKAGLARAMEPADVVVKRYGHPDNPTLLEKVWRCQNGHYNTYEHLKCTQCGRYLF
ncbi:MAG: hypothetical protein IT447_15480 [Phycisphaerales bacterium]|nr:hypothetical protein [Phycisphaerales bacterium]